MREDLNRRGRSELIAGLREDGLEEKLWDKGLVSSQEDKKCG